MLTLTILPPGTTDLCTGRPYTIDWKIGEKKPIELPQYVTKLTASGDELAMIRGEFSGFPMHNGGEVEWHDETARFIARHLW